MDGNKSLIMHDSNLNPNTFYDLRDNQMFYFGHNAKYRAKVVRIKKSTKCTSKRRTATETTNKKKLSESAIGGKRKSPDGAEGKKPKHGVKDNGKKSTHRRHKKKVEIVNLLSKPNDLKNKHKLPKLEVRKTAELLEVYKNKNEEEKIAIPEDANDAGTWKMDLGNWLQ